MSKELTEQIFTIMEREMSDIGNFIVKKQCMLIGADPEDIEPRDLPELASNLSEVMRTFGGYEKARKIYSEIKKLENLDQVVAEEESEDSTGSTDLFSGPDWSMRLPKSINPSVSATVNDTSFDFRLAPESLKIATIK